MNSSCTKLRSSCTEMHKISTQANNLCPIRSMLTGKK